MSNDFNFVEEHNIPKREKPKTYGFIIDFLISNKITKSKSAASFILFILAVLIFGLSFVVYNVIAI